MQNPPEEGEDFFFDSFDYLSTSFRSTSSEDTSTKNLELEFENFGCEVWTSELRSIRERRDNFLHKMGFDDLVPSESCCSQEICHEYSGELLQRLGLDAETGAAVLGSSSSKILEGDQHCVRSLGREKVFDVNELDQDSLLSTTYGEVDSSGVVRSGMPLGLCHSVQQPIPKDNGHFVGRKDGQIANTKKTFKCWLKGLSSRRSGDLCERSVSAHSAQVHKTGRTRVQHHGKCCTEFTGVHMDQGFQAHKGSICVMKFSPDGRYLATGGEDCIVRVWRVVEVEAPCKHLNGDCVPKFADKVKECKLILKNEGFDSAPIFIPKKIFKLEETPLHEFHGHTSDVLDLSWSKLNYLLTSSKDKTVRMWQVGHDHCLEIFRHSNYVTCVQFNPVDNGYFISGSIDGKVRVWGISESRVIDWVDIRDIITAACYRPDGQGLVVGSITGSCRFYYLSGNGLQLDAELNIQGKKKGSNKRITGFQFTPEDPEKIMITSADSKVRIANGIDVTHKYGGLRKSKNQLSASFTSDGRYIISMGEDSRVYIWNYFSGSPSSKSKRSVRSCEYFFSKDASIAIPWPGMNSMESGSTNNSPHLQPQEILKSLSCNRDLERSCLGAWFLADCPSRAAATWPEEKLCQWAEDAGAFGICPCDGHGCHHSNLKLLSSATWGQIIVTAGHDGAIRSFHNYGLPVRL